MLLLSALKHIALKAVINWICISKMKILFLYMVNLCIYFTFTFASNNRLWNFLYSPLGVLCCTVRKNTASFHISIFLLIFFYLKMQPDLVLFTGRLSYLLYFLYSLNSTDNGNLSCIHFLLFSYINIVR